MRSAALGCACATRGSQTKERCATAHIIPCVSLASMPGAAVCVVARTRPATDVWRLKWLARVHRRSAAPATLMSGLLVEPLGAGAPDSHCRATMMALSHAGTSEPFHRCHMRAVGHLTMRATADLLCFATAHISPDCFPDCFPDCCPRLFPQTVPPDCSPRLLPRT